MKKIILLMMLFCSSAYVLAQRSCGTEEYMNEMMKDPVYAKEWTKNQEKFKKEFDRRANLGRSSSGMNEIVIPVAVHFPEGSEADRDCLEELAQNQIDILNGDFTATNSDANLWTAASAFYPGVVHGAANIRFCIATSNHPVNTDNDLVEGEPAVSIGYDFQEDPTTGGDPLWAGYLNFVVKSLGFGTLGFSPLGGSIADGQAVTLNLDAFASGAGCAGSNVVPGAPYDLGRTTTHELGHFFGLSHVWGNFGGCGDDDGIADTPLQDNENAGCPDAGDSPGCVAGEFELSMNYMDYTNDACMYMFSQGQIDVVDTYIAGVLEAQFKPNTVPVCVNTPEYTMTDGLINTCNGIFYDSGGADAIYSNNETFTYTICPENPGQIIQLDFTSFSTQAGADILSIYNADNADDPTTLLGEYSGTDPADNPGTVAATTTNTSGCLTFVFTSNAFGTDTGWQANISCQDPPTDCQTVLAQLDSAFPEPNADGYIFVCPGEEITLTGSGTFSEPGGGDGATYQWETGDGTVIDGQTAIFSFDTPGVYVANLNIWDTNTSILPDGCKNTNLINQIILVSTTPDFTGTTATTDPLCFGETTTITPVVTPTTFNNDCTPPESVQTFLPDGNGDIYTTCITVNCYQSDQVIEDISDLLDICLNIEHSYVGDLEIFITSPNGVQVALHNYYGIGNGQYLGGANDDGSLQPGVGADYCFSMAGNDILINGNLVIAGTNPQGPSIEPGLYLPEESFENLIGSPINGDWCIEVVDNLGADNGYIFSWELNFNPALTPANLSFTPEIVSGSWANDPTITQTNGDIITVAPPTEGQFCYTYTVVDNFGCEYAHEVCVDVLPEIIFDAPKDLLICDPAAPPYIFDLSENEATMLAPNPNPADYIVTFHNTIADAENDTVAITDTTAYSGTDNEEIFVRFEYLNSNCFEIESFQLKLIDLPQIFAAQDIVKCDDLSNDGVEAFDLELRTPFVLGTQSATDYEVTYHVDLASAEAGTGNLTSPYLSTSDTQGIYVRVQAAGGGGGGCFIVSPNPLFNLIVTNKATATIPGPMVECDDGSGGYFSFDLESQTNTILGAQDSSNFTVTYHATQSDAENNTAALSSLFTNTVAYGQTIYARVEEAGLPNCYETTEFDLIVEPLPTTTTMTPLPECDDDADGITAFTLTDRDVEALGGQTGVTVSYHATLTDAEAGSAPLSSPFISTSQQIFVRLTSVTNCYSTMPLDLVVNPLPVPELAILPSQCDDDGTEDGLQTFDMSGVAAQVIGTQTGMVVSYHLTPTDAENNTGALGDTITTTTPDMQTIHIRLENALTRCYATSTIDLVVDPLPTIATLIPYVLCDYTNSGDLQEEFNLSTKDLEVINGQDAVVSYHATATDAESNTAPLPTLYTTGTQTIFVGLEDNITGCRSVAEFDLIVEPLPTTTTMTPLPECDDDADGITAFTLTDRDVEALGGQTGVTVSYHATLTDAEAGSAPLSSPFISTSQQIFVRLTSVTNCYSTMPLDLVVNPLPVPELAILPSQCDDDGTEDGLQTFDMSGVAAQVIGTQTGMVVSYHLTPTDAENNTGALGDTITTTTPDMQTIHIRLENALTRCYATSTIDLVVDPLPTIATLIPYVLCDYTNSGDLQEEFNLSTKDLEVINGQDAVVSYHATATDAESNTAPLPTLYTTGTQTIFVGLEDNITGCRSVAEFDLIVEPLPTTTTMTPLPECDDDADGITAFTLTDRDVEALGGQTGVTVSYHATLTDAEAGSAPLSSPFISTSQQIFVRLTSVTNCYSTMPLDLVVNPLPVPELAILPSQCDDDGTEDGLQTFDMSGVAAQVIGTQTGMVVSYHLTPTDAENNTGALGDTITTTTPDMQTIHIRLENALTRCYATSTIDLVVDPLPTIATLIPYVLCDYTNSGDLQEEFNLSTKDLEVINGQDAVVSYHATATDAESNTAPLPTLYTTGTQTIFVGLEDNITGCRSVAEFDLIVEPLPTTTTMTPLPECDDDADGITAFTLTDRDVEALGGQTGVTVSYHATLTDAEAGSAPLSSPFTSTSQQIFVRLTSVTNCYSTMPLDLVVNPLPVPELAILPSQCDDDGTEDGLQTFDMSGVAAQVIGTQTGMVVSYHLTPTDAENNTGALGDTITTTTPDMQTIHIRLENALTRCYATRTIDLVVDPLPVVDLDDNYVICEDTTGGGLDYIVIDPGLSATAYNFTWRDQFGSVLSSDSTYTIDEGGIYSLEVNYNSTGCSSPLEIFTVSESGAPAVTVDVVTEDFADTHVVIASAVGTGVYEFSLDQGPWLDSGTFIGVDPGEHTVYVRDVNGCGTTATEIYIVDYPKYFTPNGDGYHDTWNLAALSGQLGSKIYIFDRYGKLLKQISPAGDGWDGTYNGQPMPTSDYWFTLEYNDLKTGQPKQLKAHFSLKR